MRSALCTSDREGREFCWGQSSAESNELLKLYYAEQITNDWRPSKVQGAFLFPDPVLLETNFLGKEREN